MGRIWREKVPGQNTFDVSDELGQGGGALLYANVPNVVRLPPNLGGKVVGVLSAENKPCPCRSGHTVQHLTLEDNYGVAECQHRGFLWYRRKSV